jgi:hydroxymethylbilane synthase
MATRLDRAAREGAGVVALAALDRLGLAGRIAEVLETGTLLPQVAQGALAVECRADDDEIRSLLAAIDDPVAHRAVTAERSFLAALGGGCTLPVGALASPSGATVTAAGRRPLSSGSDGGPGEGTGLSLEGLLASRDGRILLRRTCRGEDPVELGRRVAADLLDHGGTMLDDWVPTPSGEAGR